MPIKLEAGNAVIQLCSEAKVGLACLFFKIMAHSSSMTDCHFPKETSRAAPFAAASTRLNSGERLRSFFETPPSAILQNITEKP